MAWKSGKIFTRNGKKGRYYYWNGSKSKKVFRSLKQKRPTRSWRSRHSSKNKKIVTVNGQKLLRSGKRGSYRYDAI